MKTRFLALFCVLILLLSAVPSAAASEGESRRAAQTLSSLQIIDAVPSDEALSENLASRAHAVEVLTRLYGLSKASLPSGAYDYAVAQGWVNVTAGQSDPIPTPEFFADLLRQLGYTEGFSDENGGVFARRIGLAVRDYGEELTLGQLYQLVRDALPFPGADGTAPIQRLADKGICSQELLQSFYPEEMNARQIAERCLPAVFSLRVYYTEKSYENDHSSNGGSAFFISADGLAVTNYHTIAQAVLATATLITGETFPVEEVVFYDPDADVALLRISKTSTDGYEIPFFSYLELAKDPDLRRGETIYTLGVPLGLLPAISQGVISATNHFERMFSYPCIINSADISHGSSGGALLNVYGHVVGITSGSYESGNSLYISVPLTPILKADWEAEGISLAQVVEEMTHH